MWKSRKIGMWKKKNHTLFMNKSIKYFNYYVSLTQCIENLWYISAKITEATAIGSSQQEKSLSAICLTELLSVQRTLQSKHLASKPS